MRHHLLSTLGVVALSLILAPVAAAQQPDLSGTYDTATLTPLQRPREFGDRLSLTDEEAAAVAAGASTVFSQRFNVPEERDSETGPPREAPPVGGDGSTSAAGNVGGYNSFWIDPGTTAIRVDCQWRTSIVTDPANGRFPPRVPSARGGANPYSGGGRTNTGTAWWLEDDLNAPGPYDDPEIRPLAERCLLGFSSTGGPPMLPALL